MKESTAVIKKGKNQFVALCSELGVVSEEYVIEDGTKDLKEAYKLYIEEIVTQEGV